jgi:hypothetical protein
VLAGHPLVLALRSVLALRLSPRSNSPPDVEHVLTLAGHNIPIAAWPLLLGVLGAERHSAIRRIADVALLASTTANVLPVGAALGSYGASLLVYIPQLPLEWAALALGAGSWLVGRDRALSTRACVVFFALIVCLLLCAAVLESVAVPHR